MKSQLIGAFLARSRDWATGPPPFERCHSYMTNTSAAASLPDNTVPPQKIAVKNCKNFSRKIELNFDENCDKMAILRPVSRGDRHATATACLVSHVEIVTPRPRPRPV